MKDNQNISDFPEKMKITSIPPKDRLNGYNYIFGQYEESTLQIAVRKIYIDMMKKLLEKAVVDEYYEMAALINSELHNIGVVYNPVVVFDIKDKT